MKRKRRKEIFARTQHIRKENINVYVPCGLEYSIRNQTANESFPISCQALHPDSVNIFYMEYQVI